MKQFLTLLAALLMLPLSTLRASGTPVKRPNVSFIAVDDLNDWIGCLGGHPQTPNFDRLAASGVLMKNAYCDGAACDPSRAAIMIGLPLLRLGLCCNRQRTREVWPAAELLPKVTKEVRKN
jgi:arylsulfatase A-like enzyme